MMTAPKSSKMLKCNKCELEVVAEHDQVDTAIHTCRTVQCGLVDMRDMLMGKKGFPSSWVKLDPDKLSHYPYKRCEKCQIDVANAYECRSLLHKHTTCPLKFDGPPSQKKQLPAILNASGSQPIKHIRDIIAQARGESPATPAQLEAVFPDPISIYIDKKGHYHYVVNPQ